MKPVLALLSASLLLACGSLATEPPRTLDELWAGFDPREGPLESEILREWEQDGVVCRIVRYQVGTFKGAPSKVAGFYAFPKGARALPGLLHLHGGGQSANLRNVVEDAQNGYASLSLNWGGNKMNLGSEAWAGPQTDWGRLDATHPPQRNQVNHFAGGLAPDEFTLDSVESPRNSNWFVVLMAARRAVTFLEQQPEVNPERIGAYGHSMGGKLTTCLAGIEPRIKAAVPSCGGAGHILESQTDLPGCVKKTPTALELACISDNAYLPRITCPILWLSPTNDFNAPIGNMAWNWRNLPDGRTRFSISPHLNHRHTEAHAVTRLLWFEEHLKDAFRMPQTPQLAVNLKTPDGVPKVTVTPDATQPIQRVDLYYSIDPHELTRFWRDAQAVPRGDKWTAACPVMSLDQPLFVYANVVYALPAEHVPEKPASDNEDSTVFAISSRVHSFSAAQLQAADVKATDLPERTIDDGSRGWQDWYRLNWGHPPLWAAFTRKLKDPRWRGPDGAKLVFDIQCHEDNSLVIRVNCNAWGAFPGEPSADYAVVKELEGSPDWQTVSVSLSELAAVDARNPEPPANWRTVTEFSFGPGGEASREGGKVKINGKPWKGPREIRHLRWEGGDYAAPTTTDAGLTPEELEKGFNEAIKKSLKQEKADQESQ